MRPQQPMLHRHPCRHHAASNHALDLQASHAKMWNVVTTGSTGQAIISHASHRQVSKGPDPIAHMPTIRKQNFTVSSSSLVKAQALRGRGCTTIEEAVSGMLLQIGNMADHCSTQQFR